MLIVYGRDEVVGSLDRRRRDLQGEREHAERSAEHRQVAAAEEAEAAAEAKPE